MANVFGGGGALTPSCNDGGITRVLPTSSETLQSSQQTFSSSPNVYAKSQLNTSNLSLKDFYNKADIHRLLKTKADISSVYTKPEVDDKLYALQSQLNQTLSEFVTESEVDAKISESFDNVVSYLEENYYEKEALYTKIQIDSLFAELELGNDFVSLAPETTLRNTIDPGDSPSVALTLKASSNPNIDTIQHWVDSQSNSVGRIRKSGRVEFYGHMFLGQAIESWRPALDANVRRISGVADPIHTLDAVNKKYMEDFIVEAVDNIQRGEDLIFDIDCLTY